MEVRKALVAQAAQESAKALPARLVPRAAGVIMIDGEFFALIDPSANRAAIALRLKGFVVLIYSDPLAGALGFLGVPLLSILRQTLPLVLALAITALSSAAESVGSTGVLVEHVDGLLDLAPVTDFVPCHYSTIQSPPSL